MSPLSRYIPSTSYRCRSEPQIAVDVIRTIASVGSWILGSGTVSTDTLDVPCQVSARMPWPPIQCCHWVGAHCRAGYSVVSPPVPGHRHGTERGGGQP